jgi:hypothetical protein
MASTRLRQVALVARELAPVAERLQKELDLPEPFHDPGVGEVGLEKTVWAVGDTLLEVVAPVREGTTAGRLLDKRGDDGGYMAIFQVPDIATARQRIADAGVRVVWTHDLDDIGGTHLHPKDVPGAIVSIDWADPPATWRWAGPSWTGTAPDHRAGGITAITVRGDDPDALAERWAAVLGEPVDDGPSIFVDGGSQVIRFTDGGDGITDVEIALPADVRAGRDAVDACGVRFTLVDAP